MIVVWHLACCVHGGAHQGDREPVNLGSCESVKLLCKKLVREPVRINISPLLMLAFCAQGLSTQQSLHARAVHRSWVGITIGELPVCRPRMETSDEPGLVSWLLVFKQMLVVRAYHLGFSQPGFSGPAAACSC